jgi:hypothetical protein
MQFLKMCWLTHLTYKHLHRAVAVFDRFGEIFLHKILKGKIVAETKHLTVYIGEKSDHTFLYGDTHACMKIAKRTQPFALFK